MGVPLSAEDRATIDRFHRRFIADGLSLMFQSTGRAPQSYYPTLRDLLRETDESGRQASYLASEDAFQFVKGLQARDLVIPVVGDLSGPSAVAAIGRALEARRERLSAFYVSNVEFYLFARRNLSAVPGESRQDSRTCRTASSFDPFSAAPRPSRPGDASVNQLQSIDELLREYAAGRVRQSADIARAEALSRRDMMLLAALAISGWLSAGAVSQAPPTFPARGRSSLPRRPPRRAARPRLPPRGDMGSGWGSPLTITQDAKQLVVEQTLFGRWRHAAAARASSTRSTGSETRNTVMIGPRHANARVSRATWDGQTLQITTTYPAVDPVSGKPFTTEVDAPAVARVPDFPRHRSDPRRRARRPADDDADGLSEAAERAAHSVALGRLGTGPQRLGGT